MNISSLIRSVMGEPQGSQAKVLDLKQGGIVRGVVVRDLGNQEAMVAINGVQIRAKLETPLNQGETTMLEVQGETENGEVILRPIANSEMLSTMASRAEMLKSFGVANTEVNRELLSHMQEAGVPLTKENVQKFAELLAEKPLNVDAKIWVGAAAVAQARGIPLSGATINAMLEAMTGPSLTEHLGKLEAGIQAVLKDTGLSLSNEVRGSLMKAVDLLHQVEQLTAGSQRSSLAAVPEATREAVAPSVTQGPAASQAAGPRGDNTASAQPSGGSVNPAHVQQAHGREAIPGGGTAPGGVAPAPSPAGGWIGNVLKLLGVEHENLLAKAVLANNTATGAQDEAPEAPAGSLTAAASQEKVNAPLNGQMAQSASIATRTAGNMQVNAQSNIQGSIQGAQVANQQSVTGSIPGISVNASTNSSVIQSPVNPNLHTGTESNQPEHTTAADQKAPPNPISNNKVQFQAQDLTHLAKARTNAALELFAPSSMPVESAANHSVRETLKSLLLSLGTTNELPPALKEAMQSVVQQITGQQLLLSADRTSPFAHVTLFIPFTNGDRLQTASVHIQSRKGDKGVLDSNNCRLLFDLQMNAMGDTLVDVQVVNSIVSLQVHNDHEEVGHLIESFREEIARGVNQLGFQFLSLKCSRFPQESIESLTNGQVTNDTQENEINPLFMPKPYKGVDYRA